MVKKLLKVILALFVFNWNCVKAQSAEIEQLRKKVSEFNNYAKYDSSAKIITRYLEKPNITNEDRYFCNRLLSITHKYLYSYDQALIYLNKALEFGLKTKDPNYFISNVRYEKAAIFFDTKRYKEADSLIKIIEKEKYQYLTDENFINVQIEKAYLLFLEKKYEEAEVRYDILLNKMQKENPCNMPLIYAKKIELYSAMNKFDKVQENYNKS
ncbi:MAG: hypothetical protein IT236_14925, partial [Bacteroidia bacterium]|nr:hypothetical protein [Bacteroidia bacterium]